MEFRLHFKGSDGRTRRVETIECESDSEAIGIAEDRMMAGEAIELWQLNRRVCDFPYLHPELAFELRHG